MPGDGLETGKHDGDDGGDPDPELRCRDRWQRYADACVTHQPVPPALPRMLARKHRRVLAGAR